jgi:hypothetical protein
MAVVNTSTEPFSSRLCPDFFTGAGMSLAASGGHTSEPVTKEAA